MKKNKKIGWILLFLLLLGFIVYGFWQMNSTPAIMFQGQMEARQTDVAAKISARIGEVLVREGDKVQVGSLLVHLDSPEVQAKLKQAQSATKAAQAIADKAKTGARSEEIAMAYQAWQAKKAAADLANSTYQRVNGLFEQGLIAAQKRDEARTNMLAQQNIAKAALEQYQMAKSGARIEDKTAAQADAQRVQGILDEVNVAKDEIEITAPVAGEVVKVLAKVGEILPQGVPAVSIVDISDQWAVFNIQETYLKDFAIKNKFTAKIPALGLTGVEFEVYYSAVLPDFATWRSTKLGHDFDVRTYEVRARPLQPVANLRPGMTVVVQ